jgi:proteasome accessory factor C
MARRGPRSAAERLRGLLVMLPWLMQRTEVRISDMAQQFDVSEADLVDDLELASMCGVPPYTPFDLADLWVDNEFIYVGPNKQFEQRLRLRAPEAFTLSVLASAANDIPGFSQGEHLQSALHKLQRVLGENIVDVETESPEHLDVVTNAADTGEVLRIVYWTPSRNEESVRNIVVRSVFSDKGNWYVSADDSASGERRHFRVDRIRSVTPTAEFSTVIHEPVDIPQWFSGDGTSEIVTAHVASHAAWIVESYPCRNIVENRDGSFTVEIAVSSEHWLSRMALRAGDGITITAPEKFAGVAQRAARQVLSRYEGDNSAS